MSAFRSAALLLAVVCASAALGRGASSTILGVEPAGNVALFTTPTSMCRTDGTSSGTICHPVLAQLYGSPVLLNGTLYSLANYYRPALFAFDGRSAPFPAVRFSAVDSVTTLATNGTSLFAFGRRETSPGQMDLLRSDGTQSGTSLVTTLSAREVASLGGAGKAILFRVRPPSGGAETWTSDGTSAGTQVLLPGNVTALASLGSILLLRDGNRVLRTDGTTAGTFPLLDERVPESTQLTVRDGVAYFTLAQQVWRTDGTVAVPLRRLDFEPAVTSVTGDRLLFIERQERLAVVRGAHEVYGTPATLATIPIEDGYFRASATGSLTYFTFGLSPENQLWRSDGTPGGTFRLARYQSAGLLRPLGEKMLFLANDRVHGSEPWITDGTREGTFLLANLAAEGTLRGRVTERKSGLPVANAVVTVGDGREFPPVRTDDDGRYVIEGIRGEYFVDARGTVHRSLLRKAEVGPDEEATLDFELHPGARIIGRVVDPDGKPVQGAFVTLASDVGTPIYLGTGADGRFESTALWTETTWRISVERGNYNPVSSGELRLTPRETREVQLTMRPYGRLKVRMIDAVTNEPIRRGFAGAISLATLAGGHWAYGYFTDNYTAVELAALDGEYLLHSTITTHQEAWSPSPVRIASGTTQTIDFVLQPRGVSVRGIVRDAETGARIPNLFLTIFNQDGDSQGHDVIAAGGAFESRPVFPDGRVRVHVYPGIHSPYLPSETELVVRFADDPRPEIEIRLTRGATVRGRIVDANGAPVAGVLLQVTAPRHSFSDAHGYYEIPALPSGTHTFLATHAQFAPLRPTVTVTAGKITKLDLTMREP